MKRLTIILLIALLLSMPVHADAPARVDLSAYLPPIADAMSDIGWPWPVCTVYATTYYYRSFLARQAGQQITFSPAYTWMDRPGWYTGLDVGYVMEGMLQGALPLEAWPDWTRREITDADREAAQEWRIEAYKQLWYGQGRADIDTLRLYLADGQPFVTVVPVYAGWYEFGFRWIRAVGIPRPGNALHGWHSVLVVGYDDASRTFKAVNDQGAQWGRDGFALLDYDFVAQYAREGWTMQAEQVPQITCRW